MSLKIFFPDIHFILSKSIAKALDELGHTMLLPSFEAGEKAPEQYSQFVWKPWSQKDIDEKFPTKNVKSISREELFDDPPDVIFIVTFEGQFETLLHLWPKLKDKSKLAFYSGNDYWPNAYSQNMLRNYLAADQVGQNTCKNDNIKNWLPYKPWIFYDKYEYTGVTDSNLIGGYINDYEKHFPKEYNFVKKLMSATPGLNYNLLSGVPEEKVIEVMRESLATIHIKIDGYGFGIIQSMASGRPVLLHKGISQNKSYLEWALEGETALFIESEKDYVDKAYKLLHNRDYRYNIQDKCAKVIRKIINNEEQNEKLKLFLENLV